ncbi:hypothetical protein [Peribacillus asahii]|uniref:hypothetical protein n=1 Tax=Peribacillus asahii TaxID=228899 RepID=UPI002079ED73|nr:hypothetical protein [Peribacillus asahii]USK87478.1 hypothetical protein LIT35_23670 [Peribacillus asahii]
MSNKARKEFRKAKESFERFIENENNQLAVFNALREVASDTLPGVNVTNPNALLNVANNPQQSPSNRQWSIVFLILFVLFFLLAPSETEDESS